MDGGGLGAALGGLLGLVAGPAIGMAAANGWVVKEDSSVAAMNKLAAAEGAVALLGLLLASTDTPFASIGAGMLIGAGVTTGIVVGSALAGEPAPVTPNAPRPPAIAAGRPPMWAHQYPAPAYAWR